MNPNLIGIMATVVILSAMMGTISVLSQPQSDGKVYGCGQGTYFHSNTNSCELSPPKVILNNAESICWESPAGDGTICKAYKDFDAKEIMKEMMQKQKDEFYP